MSVYAIDDPEDLRLGDFRAVSDPDLAIRRGLFIAEGRLVVRRLLTESRLKTQAVLVTASAMKSIEDVLRTRSDLPVYVVSQQAMNAVSGFNIHRGCLALGERPVPASWHDLVAQARRLVVLEHVGDADNVGAIVRSAAAFGANGILVGPACADPLYRKAIRTSMGAALTIPFAGAEPWPSVLTLLAADGWVVAALTPAADAEPLRAFATSCRADRVALVVGHEGSGLSGPAIGRCTHRVRIPIGAGVDSLNVAAATAIALYEVSQ